MTDSTQSPLYQQVKRTLLAAISRGEYEPDQPFITQREVCERYGVSTTTAVRALGELVADGVLVRHRGKGTFVADRTTPPVVPAGGPAIACIIQGLVGAHVSQIVRGVESVCAERGYRMFLSESDGSAQRQGRALRQAIDTGAGGVVLYSVEGEANTDLIEELRRRRIPLVLVDRYRTDLATDAVVADDFGLGYEMTRQLIESGHRRIATLWGETNCTSVRDRLTGHEHALREHGLPILPELTMLRSYRPLPAGAGRSALPDGAARSALPDRAARSALPDGAGRSALSRLLEGTPPPTALLCANGYILAGAATDLLHLGGELPGQVDLASMDDAGPYDIVPLTVLAAALPSFEIGQRAAELVISRIGTDDPYREVRRVVLGVRIRRRSGAGARLSFLTH
jgi:DNA-binding LacI/PurR family transcriptional regulator